MLIPSGLYTENLYKSPQTLSSSFFFLFSPRPHLAPLKRQRRFLGLFLFFLSLLFFFPSFPPPSNLSADLVCRPFGLSPQCWRFLPPQNPFLLLSLPFELLNVFDSIPPSPFFSSFLLDCLVAVEVRTAAIFIFQSNDRFPLPLCAPFFCSVFHPQSRLAIEPYFCLGLIPSFHSFPPEDVTSIPCLNVL